MKQNLILWWYAYLPLKRPPAIESGPWETCHEWSEVSYLTSGARQLTLCNSRHPLSVLIKENIPTALLEVLYNAERTHTMLCVLSPRLIESCSKSSYRIQPESQVLLERTPTLCATFLSLTIIMITNLRLIFSHM